MNGQPYITINGAPSIALVALLFVIGAICASKLVLDLVAFVALSIQIQ